MAVQCSVCKEQLSTKYGLLRHMRRKHPEEEVILTKKYNFKCLENECNAAFDRHILLRDHLIDAHAMEFEEIEFTVSSMSEFEDWKKEMERESVTYYRINKKQEHNSYYYCNRSGRNTRKSDKMYQRKEKGQGSCKIGSNCTSFIKLEHRKPNKIKVLWQRTHYGHTPLLQHIRIPKEDRLRILSNLINGVPPTTILQATANSNSPHPRRIDFLTRKDISNIKGSINIERLSEKQIAPSRSPSVSRYEDVDTFTEQSPDDDKRRQLENSKQALDDALNVINVADYDDEVLQEINNCLLACANKLLRLSKMKKVPKTSETQNIRKISPPPILTPTKEKRKTNRTNICVRPNHKETGHVTNGLFASEDEFLDHNYIR